jgi:NAD(P)-dependent dehydrogenase (short-subunit alcohol dehydrogenase family)
VRQAHSDLVVLELDVTDRARVAQVVDAAQACFDGLDVVVNNAGYGHFGAVEEVAEADARAQFDTNVFGPLWVAQAAVPHLRRRGRGHLVNVGSQGGLFSFPLVGLYNASKWALEGLTEALSIELRSFGVAVSIFEPGGMLTDWAGPSAVRSAAIDAYQPLWDQRAARQHTGMPAEQAVRGLLWLVDQEDPPLRLLYPPAALEHVEQVYADRIERWRTASAQASLMGDRDAVG